MIAVTDAAKRRFEQARAFAQPSPELRRAARRRITYSETGNRMGESHPRAVLTDHEVALMLALREEGKTYPWLSEKFEIPLMTVRSICRGRTRGLAVVRVVEVPA